MENQILTKSYLEKYQSDIWILINIIFPLIPIVIGAVIRFAYSPKLSWTTVSASDLAICISLLSLLIFLSLMRQKQPKMNNEDKEAQKIKIAIMFLILILISIFLYTAIIICNTTVNDLKDEKYEPTLHFFEFIILFLLSPFALIFSISTQRTFELKADII